MPLLSAPTGDIRSWQRREQSRLAKSTGFISEVLTDNGILMRRAEELATTLAGHAPLTLRATKEALRRLAAQTPSGDDLIWQETVVLRSWATLWREVTSAELFSSLVQ